MLAILGMHRSYTSLTASWLDACGLDLGARQLGADTGNERGHFEDLDFYEFHIAMLRASGLPENGMVTRGQPHFDAARYKAISWDEAAARRLLQAKPDTFAWKEPRTCLFLPHYRALADFHCIAVYRDYREVVQSLMEREARQIAGTPRGSWLRRAAFPLQRPYKRWQNARLADGFLAAWCHYNECILDHVAAVGPQRAIVCDLDRLARDDAAIAEQLQGWGFPLDYRPIAGLMAERRPPVAEIDGDPALVARANVIAQRFLALARGEA